ncbi:regulatory protein, gntR family [Papillibacter cinnamivorans DSM 12816]|uniref:Regulatory protein, gntR family n=2 Tax=Papillibacter TaxID=100175 RepID=A0A1W2B0S2_9FIRM|nr:regulatory protein, gntR family [Papillibacter cinnamivorans DSM 12816]
MTACRAAADIFINRERKYVKRIAKVLHFALQWEAGDGMYSTGQITTARYLKIAVDLAARIASGEIPERERLKGRSVLSSEYGVSSETIRRAMSILCDKKVVEVNIGSGITVLSREKAVEFVKSFKNGESIAEMNSALSSLFEKRKALDEEISSTTGRIIDMYKYMRSDLITPVEIVLPEGSHVIGRSIGALEVWHNTGATVIGILQGNQIIISPGPYYEFTPGDRVLIVGDESVIERFNLFIRGA